MKKLLFLGVGSALIFTMGGVGTAQADTSSAIHKSTAAIVGGASQLASVGGSRCAGCHRAHTAKAEMLLKQAQPGLCYTCHGGAGSVLDVVDGVDAGTTSTLRGGGFAFAGIDGALASKLVTPPATVGGRNVTTAIVPAKAISPVTSRHQIDGVTQGTMWGNGAVSDVVAAPTGTGLAAGKTGVTLECGSCHDPHGNGNYRILKPVPNDAATEAKAAVTAVTAVPAVIGVIDDPLTTTVNEFVAAVPAVIGVAAAPAVLAVAVLPVKIPDAGAKVYTTTNYWDVRDLNVPLVNVSTDPLKTDMTDGYIANVAQWCSTCHTRYLAGSGSYKTALTDAGGKVDATFTYRHRSDRIDKGGKARPNCIQCHVSHGSNVAMTSTSATATMPDGSTPAGGGTAGFDPSTNTTPGAANVGTSRLLRVDNRGTCVMCHNV